MWLARTNCANDIFTKGRKEAMLMTDDEKAEEGFRGEIGKNLYYSREEQEEDILEAVYSWWKDGQTATTPQICMHFDLTKREATYYVRQMVRHGYLREPDGNNLELTAFGKAEGAECLRRHRHLTHFLQMVCGIDADLAEENACRMEHVVSGEVMHGICDFIRYGDTYDRTVKGANLRSFYDEGTYMFCMGIYETEKRYPRVLAKENAEFSDSVLLEVSNEKSSFYLQELQPAEDQDRSYERVWYKCEADWREAPRTERGIRLPTEAFTFMFGPQKLVTEGFCILAFGSGEQTEPDENSYRELNVHIW